MKEEIIRCENCGSAGSIEFGMCQVCLYDYSRAEEGEAFPSPSYAKSVPSGDEVRPGQEIPMLLAS